MVLTTCPSAEIDTLPGWQLFMPDAEAAHKPSMRRAMVKALYGSSDLERRRIARVLEAEERHGDNLWPLAWEIALSHDEIVALVSAVRTRLMPTYDKLIAREIADVSRRLDLGLVASTPTGFRFGEVDRTGIAVVAGDDDQADDRCEQLDAAVSAAAVRGIRAPHVVEILELRVRMVDDEQALAARTKDPERRHDLPLIEPADVLGLLATMRCRP